MNLLSSAFGWLSDPANWSGSDGIPTRFLEHLDYFARSLLLALLIAIPLGLFTGHTGRGGFALISVANAARALPTLGIVIIVVLTIGLGVWPVLISMTVLAIPSILVNTFEGIRNVDADLKDAARGMGMTGWQVLTHVELPVAMPLILVGIRTAAILIVSTATIAAYVGLGGFGRYIIDGLSIRAIDTEVAGGAILVVALALLVGAVFIVLRRMLVPAGVRHQS
ncbi:MAG: ABC transporter permease [Actinomycetes bacterium]